MMFEMFYTMSEKSLMIIEVDVRFCVDDDPFNLRKVPYDVGNAPSYVGNVSL